MHQNKITSLANTKLYPGRYEFDAVLDNLPSIIVCPISSKGILILGGWSERCFNKTDEKWIMGWSQRIKNSLENCGLASSYTD